MREQQLPPGPRAPKPIQSLGWWKRPISYLERCRTRYGKTFTANLLGAPPFVMHCDPEDIKAIFTAPPDVLHSGEGTQILDPVVGSYSLIRLDEDAHMEQRKLLLPAFHGEKMAALTGLMTEVAEREVASWPRDKAEPLHPRIQSLTLEIILRAVFGLDPGPRMEALRAQLTSILEIGLSPVSLIPGLQRSFWGRSVWARFLAMRDEADRLIFGLVDERRREGVDRDDVLSMLLAARHEDGTEMTPQELRDELMTLLVAGHETTASELAWLFERVVREPAVMRRLVAEVDSGNGEAYITATINEALRRRPVLLNAAPRLVKKPIEVGRWTYEPGVCLVANAYLVQHDPELYPDPYAFRPERFLDEKPGTYTWIPFGGGRRRCLGASFAIQEMQIVLRTILEHAEVQPASSGAEVSRRRAITISPGEGATVVLRDRVREPALV